MGMGHGDASNEGTCAYQFGFSLQEDLLVLGRNPQRPHTLCNGKADHRELRAPSTHVRHFEHGRGTPLHCGIGSWRAAATGWPKRGQDAMDEAMEKTVNSLSDMGSGSGRPAWLYEMHVPCFASSDTRPQAIASAGQGRHTRTQPGGQHTGLYTHIRKATWTARLVAGTA